MLQVAATSLGLPLSAVRLAPTRTDKVPNTSATAASSGADLNGGAVKNACEQIKTRLAEIAAMRLNVHPDDVRFHDGIVTGLADTDEQIPFADLVHEAYFRRVQLWAAGFYRTSGLHWDAKRMHGSPFKYFAYGIAASEVEVDGFTGAYRLRLVDIVHDVGDSLSPLIDLGQVEGGFVQGAGWLTLEDLRWDTSDRPSRGRLATQAASTYKLPSFSQMPEDFRVTADGAGHRGRRRLRVEGRRRAAADARVQRARGAARGGGGVRAARALRRPGLPVDAGAGVLGGRGGACRSADARRRGREPMMHWITAVAELRRARQPECSSRWWPCAGTRRARPARRWWSASARCWGTIGGGNLEETAVRRARELLDVQTREPETDTTSLTERAPARYGVQCCGGEVTLLYEPLRPVPAVAIFGMGHVGLELARILARHDLELHLVDSRAAQVEPERLGVVTADALARVHRHHAPVPELVLGELPAGSHVLIMTHDHAEDAALCDAALRCGHLGWIGLIGSSAKWRRFEKKLAAEGHGPETLARITTPIGLPEITGKDPATIAVAVAADLVLRFERAQAGLAEQRVS